MDNVFSLIWDSKRLGNYLKYRPYNLLATPYINLFIEDSIFKNFESKYKDFMSFYSLNGFIGIDFLDLTSKSKFDISLKNKIDKITNYSKDLYISLNKEHSDRLKILATEIKRTSKLQSDFSWQKAILSQLMELEFEGINSSNLLYAFANFDSQIALILNDDNSIKNYRYLLMLTCAYSREPNLTNSIVDQYYEKFQYFPTNNDLTIIQNWENQISKVIDCSARDNIDKLYDTTGVIEAIINLLEDSNNMDLSKLVSQLSDYLQNADLNSLIDILNDLSELILRKYNQIIRSRNLLFSSKPEILQNLGKNVDEFIDMDSVITLLDSIGFYKYFNENGEIIIKKNISIISSYFKGYRV